MSAEQGPVELEAFFDAEELTAALAAEESQVPALEIVRAGPLAHLVPAHSEVALCGRLLDAAWATARSVSCPACAAVLAPEAGTEPATRSLTVDASRARA